MKNQRKKSLALYTACGVFLAGAAYSLYTYYFTDNQEELGSKEIINDNKKFKFKSSQSITIIITNSIISSNLPIVEILRKSDNVTFILTEDLNYQDLTNIDESDTENFDRLKYKIIKVDKNESITPVINHLSSDCVGFVKGEFELDSKYLKSDIVELDQNFTSINETLLSYIRLQ